MIDDIKCACADCQCMVKAGKGIEKDGKTFCCEACAEGHANSAKCEHAGCGCHG